MGGLIGMLVCGTPHLPLPVKVRRLVLNDVGPAIQWQAVQRPHHRAREFQPLFGRMGPESGR